MKFKKAEKEVDLILDPSYNGKGAKGILKGKKDHNDESIEIGDKAVGQKKK